MSQSPPVQRFQTTGSTSSRHEELSRQEELINAYEAEEERIINLLSRKLEQVHYFFPPHLRQWVTLD